MSIKKQFATVLTPSRELTVGVGNLAGPGHKIDPQDLVDALANVPGGSQAYIYLRDNGFDWTEEHDRAMVSEGYLLRHSCKRRDIWAKDGARDIKCDACGRLIQPSVLLRIQLKPEQEAAMREVLHVRGG